MFGKIWIVSTWATKEDTTIRYPEETFSTKWKARKRMKEIDESLRTAKVTNYNISLSSKKSS